ncbi:hypothetical protein Vretimale_20058 [Volvox reticuliferus]|uniref:Uncharacterized protein n=1 Tax=Volvox reticuliferus TaxID=1737510 RepID=A0A8J4M140_9CHLO|nr:hypothetical protein Vretimale_14186 [Volvox reticuliferus]GIM17513.1 hypothetical protein Vretimale_20058 [Volvox reticuliferus]
MSGASTASYGQLLYLSSSPSSQCVDFRTVVGGGHAVMCICTNGSYRNSGICEGQQLMFCPPAAPRTPSHTYIHTYTHTHMHTYTHAHMHTYTHAHIHTYTHTHIHTYRRTCSSPEVSTSAKAIRSACTTTESTTNGGCRICDRDPTDQGRQCVRRGPEQRREVVDRE